MVDAVVHRRDLKATVGRLLRHMSGKPAVAGWASV
jgi:acetyl-CoA carboxylase beta subunit